MGSGRGGSSNTKANNGGGGGGAVAATGSGSVVSLQSIPAGSRKIVQSLKEIVNCPEPEIYSMLKECNMDPNETVNRLLSQDPFHEVKSKRDKKKEVKDTSEFRSRGPSGTSNRGRSAADRYSGRGSSTQHSSTDSGALQGRPAYRKENGSTPSASSLSSAPAVAGSNISRRPSTYSDVTAPEVKVPAVGMADNISSTPQTSSGYQSTWVGAPGQVSMADIVKMGKPKVPAQSNSTHNINHQHVQVPPSAALQHNLRSSEDYTPKVSEEGLESTVSSSQHLTVDDEWPSIEHPSTSTVPSVSKNHIDAELHPDPTTLPFDVDRHSLTENIEPVEDDTTEDHGADHVVGSVSLSGMHEDNSGGASLFDTDLYRKRGSYQPRSHTLEHQEVEHVSTPVTSVTANLEQLSIQKEDRGLLPEDNGPAVVIPDHLQVQSADCSHLSFGSFGSGISPAFSGPLSSMPVNTNVEEEPVVETDAPSVGHSDTRNSEYYVDESLRNASDGHLFHRTGTNSGNYDPASPSQPESLKVENPEMEQGNQYPFPSAAPGYAYENPQQLNIGFSQSQTSSQMQNLAAFPSVMPSYTNSLPNTLLAANAPPGREADLPYSPFPASQSTTTKYGNTVSSISGPTISMAEALKTANFSSAQPTQQTIPGTSVATGPALPQHLAAHPYSQPTLPVGPFTNMIGYPFMPQSYAYMPSAFQQAFAGNTTYHQSLAAAMLPQYKNSVSVSSLAQSAAVPSGYGGFGSTTTIPANFPMNPPTAPSGTNLGYDDVLGAQYKENSHLMSLQQQQNDNSGLWLHGPGSRTMSAHPANTYYNYQGQSQQTAGFRQGQQPSQSYGALGYPNFYHSQTGISLDHQQQQNPRDGSLGGSQGQPKQSQQLWQNTY